MADEVRVRTSPMRLGPTTDPEQLDAIAVRLHRFPGLTGDQIAALVATLDPDVVDAVSDEVLAEMINGTLPSLPANPGGGLPLGLPGAILGARFAGGTVSGAPTTGTFQVRDWVVDGSGAIWVCTVAGSPGAWVTSGNGTSASSGFPLRQSSEQAVMLALENGVANASATSPAGPKPIVIAEEWGKPGILRRLWYAANGGSTALSVFPEDAGIVRVYLDDPVTPVCTLSMNDFFMSAPRAAPFDGRRVKRTSLSTQYSSGERYLFASWQRYMRVEVEHTGSADTSGVFLQADYTVGATSSGQQAAWKVAKYENATHAKQTPATVCDFDGAGQVEAVWIAVASPGSNSGVMEGNVEIYVDGQIYPAYRSSGMEDFVGSGWYNPNNVVGGYPAGQSGLSDQTGTNFTYYRFFSDTPVYFSSHLKVVVWAGQPGESDGGWAASTVGFSAFCSYWLNSRILAPYVSPDTASTPVFSDQFAYSGTLSSSVWGSGGTTATATPAGTGSTIVVPYDVTANDTRIWRKGVGTLPANYWAEARVRITTVNTNGFLFFFVKGNNTDPTIAVRASIAIRPVANTGYWTMAVWDGFQNPFANSISNGRDMTGQWFKLALKVVGTKITAYWNPDDPLLPWIPLGSWTTGQTGAQVGLSETSLGVEYDYLTIRPLATVT
jgi:hypothetical protein